MTQLPSQLRARHDIRVRAVLEQDERAMRDVFSDDLVFVHGGGSIDSKESYIEKRLRPKHIVVKGLEFSDLKAKVSDDMILVYGNLEITEFFPADRQRTPNDNRPPKTGDHVFPVRVTEVWRKEGDGVWRLSHSHTCGRSSPNAQ